MKVYTYKNSCLFVIMIAIALGLANICHAQETQGKSKLFPDRKVTDLGKRFVYAQARSLKNPFIDRFGNASRIVKQADRTAGDKILDLAVIYWVDRDNFTLSYLKDWCREAIKVEQWGNNNDLEISHLLYALSIVYDWHRDKLGFKLRQNLKEFIYAHAKYQYEYAVKTKGRWWADAYWQNHCWINYTSILASGMALSEDYPETKDWITFAGQKIENTVSLWSDEGSNHEGLNYSVYGNLWLVRALTLLQGMDKDIFNKSAYLKNWYKYFEAYSVNDHFDTFFDTGDSPRTLLLNPCEIFLRLYQVYGTEEYKKLYFYYLKKYDALKPGLFTVVYGLLPDEKVAGINKAGSYFSEDLGILIQKQFNKKPGAAFLFKSGVPGGKSAYFTSNQNKNYRLDRSHEHPDQNNFIIWAGGRFLISDTGYTNLKLTVDHNTLLVNDRGQLGEGKIWFQDREVNGITFSPHAGLAKESISSDEAATIVSADAAEFYPKDAGVKEFLRSILWIKSVGFVVFDRVNVEKPSNLKLIFHSDLNIQNTKTDEFELRQGKKLFGIFLSLFPKEAVKTISKHEVVSHDTEGSVPAGEKIVIDQKALAGRTYFVNVVFPDDIKRTVNLKEDEESFSLRIVDGNITYLILLRKNGTGPISWRA